MCVKQGMQESHGFAYQQQGKINVTFMLWSWKVMFAMYCVSQANLSLYLNAPYISSLNGWGCAVLVEKIPNQMYKCMSKWMTKAQLYTPLDLTPL